MSEWVVRAEVYPGLLSHDNNVSQLLLLSEGSDMYVRFNCVQLLMLLLADSRERTQRAILSQPATVRSILLLMEDKREIVRNEVLLLLAQLGQGSPELQNILAFQGAYGSLLQIIEKEAEEMRDR